MEGNSHCELLCVRHAWYEYDTRSASQFGFLPGGIGDRAGDQRGEMGSLTQKQIQYIMVSYRHEWCGRCDNIGQYYE